MAAFTVTTAADLVSGSDGKLSLREAVRLANADSAEDTISFAGALEGRTLVLTEGHLTIKHDVSIDGDHDNDGTEVAVSSGGEGRILNVAEYTLANLNLTDLTLTGGATSGDGDSGGAIRGEAGSTLILNQVTVIGNSTSGQSAVGGGISAASLTLIESIVQDNSTAGESATGGGISASELTLIGSTVEGNSTLNQSSKGGGIAAYFATLVDSTIQGNSTLGENSRGGGIYAELMTVIGSTVQGNRTASDYTRGGGLSGRVFTLTDSTVWGNRTSGDYSYGGGIDASGVTLTNCTVAGNITTGRGANGGGVFAGDVTLNDSTVTGNSASYNATGGGIFSFQIMANNSIISGNSDYGGFVLFDDLAGAIISSNGHNVFGTDVRGAIIGDLQGVAASLLFASIDPATGGGQLNGNGVVPLRNSVINPALGGGDPLTSLPTDQLGGARPKPDGSLPDLGAVECTQALSTSPSPNNDMLTGTPVANTITGMAGADIIKGLSGNDVLRGEAGGDILDGGAGNDLLDGGDGNDFVRYGGTSVVEIDLVAGTAKRGSELDVLSSIQGAIGSAAADTFQGDGGSNWFHGGGGRDVATGGAGLDLYDFDSVQDSPNGSAQRDRITDFAFFFDRIDLTGIDADATINGNQAFRWVGDSALTGAGQLGSYISGGNLIIRGSTDADAASEFEIQLNGISRVGFDDIYL